MSKRELKTQKKHAKDVKKRIILEKKMRASIIELIKCFEGAL